MYYFDKIISILVICLLLIVCLGILSVSCSYYVQRKNNKKQAIAQIFFVLYLIIVFAATVFTRKSGIRRVEFRFLWSYIEIFTGNIYILKEVILNIVMLMPLGGILPLTTDESVRWYHGLFLGGIISSIIEILQFILCRGLFEFDDILHNGVGCMIGCIISSYLIRWIGDKYSDKKDNTEGLGSE